MKWIRLKDRLPEPFITVLTKHEDDLFPVSAWHDGDGYWARNVEGPEDRIENSGQPLLRKPTHWMPLSPLMSQPERKEGE